MPPGRTALCSVLSLIAASAVAVTGAASPAVAAATSAPRLYSPVTSVRLLDTRSGVGAPEAPVASGHVVSVKVVGLGGIPASGVSAVVMTVTVSSPSALGSVSLWASGAARPAVQNVEFAKGQTVSVEVVAPVGGNGYVDLGVTDATVQLAGDVSGYFLAGASSAAGSFTAVPSARVLDTRSGIGAPKAPVASGHVVAVHIEGHGGVPASGVSAVLLTLLVPVPSATGSVSVWASGTARPAVQNVLFTKEQTVSTEVVAPVGSNGYVDLGVAGANVQLVGDVSGYFTGGAISWPVGSRGSPRLQYDTRSGLGSTKEPIAAGHVLAVHVEGQAGYQPPESRRSC